MIEHGLDEHGIQIGVGFGMGLIGGLVFLAFVVIAIVILGFIFGAGMRGSPYFLRYS